MTPKKKEEKNNVKYYKLDEFTPDEMVEDFFASKEEAEIKALEEDGWEIFGSFDKDTTEEEFDALMEKLVDEME